MSAEDSQIILPDSICYQLIKICNVDQELRNRYVLCNYNEEVTPVIQLFDSIHYAQIVQILEKYPCPNSRNIPSHLQSYVNSIEAGYFAVLLHNPTRNLQHKSLLIQKYKEGNFSNETVALFFDRYYVHYHKFSPYASPYRQFLKDPLLDPSQKALSDSLRHEIDLPPLDSTYYKK